MSDGVRLRQAWSDALSDAEVHFRRLLTSHSSSEWKHVSLIGEASSSIKGKAKASANPDLSDVLLHRKASKSGEGVYRAVLDVSIADDLVSLEPWKAVLTTPELRQEWDPAVEGAQLVEMFDRTTRIIKTKYTLGWPANPRDSVTISRLFQDASTIIEVSTSLPRSADEPAYLRPSPPYVRSHVTLFAWCLQYISGAQNGSAFADQQRSKTSTNGKVRITCFWQHDLRTVWNLGSTSGMSQQLGTMMVGLYKTVKRRGTRVPTLTGHGYGVSIDRLRFQIDREALTIDYTIHPEDEEHPAHSSESAKNLDGLHALREYRRLTRSIECVLPFREGWDVRITTKASSEQVQQLPWTADAIRSKPSSFFSSTVSTENAHELIIFSLTHPPLPDDHSLLKVRVIIEISGPSSGLRLNGLSQSIRQIEQRDPSSSFAPQSILQDASSVAAVSLQTSSSVNSIGSGSSKTTPPRPQLTRSATDRSAAIEKSITSRVKRSYIYFSSLLQEPEAKWKRTTEARGVSITQLDSIDPTLVVYRAEATFVGVGLWDLYGALVSPGARLYWDKTHEDAILLDDVNELTELWHFKTKPAWPVTGRDAVVLRTVYKSPSTIHVFAFSADDLHLFPNIPPVDPTVIRTQIDLQGWAIEALSPNTTQLTLLEQSDPKGWSNKASIPQQMINAVAGVGDFTIKCGGPPVLTRLAGAKANDIRYDHERGSFRIEYEGSESRRAPLPNASDEGTKDAQAQGLIPTIECELRCDVDTWATSLDIVVDPPPQGTSGLRRHRLSAGGGGLWLTISHDALFANEDRLLVIVKRGPGKEKGVVMVNGTKVNVDVEELPEQEIKALNKRKRIKPPRIPLDQPPVVGIIRRRRAEWDADGADDAAEAPELTDTTDVVENTTSVMSTSSSLWTTSPQISTPLRKFFTTAMEQATTTTQQAVAAMSPAVGLGDAVPSSSKSSMQYALEALSWMYDVHCKPSSKEWTLVTDKGLPVDRMVSSEISSVVPIHRGVKVIEGVSAEEIASVVASYDCRKQWDDRFDSATVLERFGATCHTAFVVSKAGFPFRDRGFYLSSIMARTRIHQWNANDKAGDDEPSRDSRNVIFCVSASFNPESVGSFSVEKYNPYGLPIGRVFVDGWMLETLDPYTTENFAIPSTRCTRIIAVDYAGSIPAAVNSTINAGLPRSILAVEAYMKTMSPLPTTRLPAAGVALVDKKNEDSLATQVVRLWKIKRRDEQRLLISSKYKPQERLYSSVLLLMPAGCSQWGADETTPKASKRAAVTQKSHTLDTPPMNRPETSSSPSSSWSTPPRSRSATSSTNNVQDQLRSSSSVLTLKGEVKRSTDMLVAEMIVDCKLYPEGYEIQLRSRIRDNAKYISLRPPRQEDESRHALLPIISNIYTIPASPMHSAGLNSDRPPRHLLRLTLPTAQYQISTVEDPLTGEVHSAPPKPQWLFDLQERGAIVDVDIKPAASNGKRNQSVVVVAGQEVTVANEKESLTILGRDDLQDDRISRMSILQRAADEGEMLPGEFKVPIAVAEHLLDPAAIEIPTAVPPDLMEDEVQVPSSESSDQAELGPPEKRNVVPAGPSTPAASSGGLLGFLNSYSKPLSRISVKASWKQDAAPDAVASSRRSSIGSMTKIPGGLNPTHSGDSAGASREDCVARYSLSTVIIIALIAFLIGSLLRSLLSPADFIYVVRDLREAETTSTGWREMKRLLEVKYVLGGWDFQIAAVRRHWN